MRISRLALRHFRNYVNSGIRPGLGANVFLGNNAQGKSNLIEAISYLSTSRSFRGAPDRATISSAALPEPIVYASLSAELEGARHGTVELVFTGESVLDPEGQPILRTRKHLRLDGQAARLSAALGVLPTVLFIPEDVELVGGEPALRRRYLDVLLCQASASYCRALSAYNRGLTQRNHLLRLIRHRNSDPVQLDYWDELLAKHGAVVVNHRQAALEAIAEEAVVIHAGLSPGEELLVAYVPSPRAKTVNALDEAGDGLLAELRGRRRRDIERGTTSAGPHRDDMALRINREEPGSYSSRGQRRTAALTLRLSEARYLERSLGTRPVLLFDDVMSELDDNRRRALEQLMVGEHQSFVTGLSAAPFAPGFLDQAEVWSVRAGTVSPAKYSEGDASEAPLVDEDTSQE